MYPCSQSTNCENAGYIGVRLRLVCSRFQMPEGYCVLVPGDVRWNWAAIVETL